MSPSSPLSPTFCGHIASTQDALLLFEACLSGALNHVARRPHDRERPSLIKSGNVFIYEEHSSGIKRWTDGVPWSPSRILGNFLVYRELERPFPPGEKKRAMKRSKRSSSSTKAPDQYARFDNGLSNGYNAASTTASSFESASSNGSLNKETERALIGSLVDSYGFKEDGLVKKTVSVTIGGVSHHLVSYYTVADVMNNKFNTPTKDPRFQHIIPRPDLITKQNFRTPIDEVDALDRVDDRPVYGSFSYPSNGYGMTNQTMTHRVSLPTIPISYAHSPGVIGGYGMSPNSGVYGDALASTVMSAGYNNHFVPAPDIYPASKIENDDEAAYRRYSSVVSTSADTSRSQMPLASASYSRRSSAYEQGSPIDSGVSTGSVDSKVTNDSGYSSQGFFGGLQDTSNIPPQYIPQRSLPTLSVPPVYERPVSQPYMNMVNSGQKENIWPAGNSSVGHGHYMFPQQQWASMRTS